MARVFPTDRALDDLAEVYDYSLKQWGPNVADQYLQRFDDAFQMLLDEPELLKERADCPGWLRFYRVEKHWLICDVIGERIYILTIKHGVMDLPARLAELEPMLRLEVDLMHRRITER